MGCNVVLITDGIVEDCADPAVDTTSLVEICDVVCDVTSGTVALPVICDVTPSETVALLVTRDGRSADVVVMVAGGSVISGTVLNPVSILGVVLWGCVVGHRGSGQNVDWLSHLPLN